MYRYHLELSDWNLICNMLLSEDPGAKGKNWHVSTSQAPLESEDAAGLSNLLACAVRRAQGVGLYKSNAVDP